MKTFQQFAKKAGKFFFGPKAIAAGMVFDTIDGKPFADGTLKGAEKTIIDMQIRDRNRQRFQDLRQSGYFTRSKAKIRSDQEKQYKKYLKNKP